VVVEDECVDGRCEMAGICRTAMAMKVTTTQMGQGRTVSGRIYHNNDCPS
jgi:hypothetical protein